MSLDRNCTWYATVSCPTKGANACAMRENALWQSYSTVDLVYYGETLLSATACDFLLLGTSRLTLVNFPALYSSVFVSSPSSS